MLGANLLTWADAAHDTPMRRTFSCPSLLSLIVLVPFAASGDAETRASPPYAAPWPLRTPTVFGEGVISTGDHESHPAFTPDGNTLYFLKNTPDFSFWTIVVSRFQKGRWTVPEVAPFSGQYADADPFFTADGKKLFFISNRPVPGKSKPDLDIWVAERAGGTGQLGEPVNLGAPINSSGNEWFPTVAANGTLYFGSDRPGGRGRTDLYRSRLVDGRYAEPENLGDAVNTRFDEFEACVAADESYIIFMSARPEGRGGFDLYISRRKDGVLTPAKNLGEPINSSGNELSPGISPDGKYFFFTSTRGFGAQPLERRLSYRELLERLHGPRNGLGDIYQVDLDVVLRE